MVSLQIMMPEARIVKEGSLKLSVDQLLHEIVGKEKEGLYIFDVSIYLTFSHFSQMPGQ